MEWLNYHHLLYFWLAMREGGVARAAARAGVAQPTISAQIKALELTVGHKLTQRAGRGLRLTPMGQIVYRYADEIFELGQELADRLRSGDGDKLRELHVGLADALPKLMAFRLLLPVMQAFPDARLTCHEGSPQELLPRLATYDLDLVLSDEPVPSGVRVKAFSHRLAQSGISFCCAPSLVSDAVANQTDLLRRLPMLLPSRHTALRRDLDRWFARLDLRPRCVAEFDDRALMKVFGQAGVGMFPSATLIEADVCRQFGVQVVYRTDEVRETYYAISLQRRVTHPAIVKLAQAAESVAASAAALEHKRVREEG